MLFSTGLASAESSPEATPWVITENGRLKVTKSRASWAQSQQKWQEGESRLVSRRRTRVGNSIPKDAQMLPYEVTSKVVSDFNEALDNGKFSIEEKNGHEVLVINNLKGDGMLGEQ